MLYFAGLHLCCRNINKLDKRLCIGNKVRTLGFIEEACTCHHAILLRGLNSIVTLGGSLISSCQSVEVLHV